LENRSSYTNSSIHKNYYWITRNTASVDLSQLFKRGFLKKEKQWTYINYFPVDNLNEIIKEN
jgi:hypothetical protein